MNFFYKLKTKYQRYAIQNLAMYASLLFAIGYLMLQMPLGYSIYMNYLIFAPHQVLHGQIWRILTAILYPPFAGSGIVFALLGIYIYYNFASVVEQMMGEFEYNVYFFGSLLIGEIGAIVFYLIYGINAPYLPVYTHFAVFMAFAIMYPDASILLMFVLPLKAKYLAIAEIVIYVYNFIMGTAYTRITILAALLPILLFYLFVDHNRNGGNIISNFKWKLKQKQRQKEWRDNWR